VSAKPPSPVRKRGPFNLPKQAFSAAGLVDQFGDINTEPETEIAKEVRLLRMALSFDDPPRVSRADAERFDAAARAVWSFLDLNAVGKAHKNFGSHSFESAAIPWRARMRKMVVAARDPLAMVEAMASAVTLGGGHTDVAKLFTLAMQFSGDARLNMELVREPCTK
jgi:hypothetical protein